MNHLTIINKQEVEFIAKDENIFCTSLDVAKVFGKLHKNILADIERILNDLRKIGGLQCELNFQLSFKVRKIQGFKGKARKYPYYNLTRDGFSLLAMGFTGKKALQWKILFINAFNKMENIAKNRNPNTYLNEITETISKILPTHNFRISFEVHDQDKNKKYSFLYAVGGGKYQDYSQSEINKEKMSEVGIHKDEKQN